MKKFYVLSILVLFAVSAFAQKVATTGTKMPVQEMTIKTPTDTLIPGNWASLTGPVLYGCQGGGYLLGSNIYGDVAKGQVFIVVAPYTIEGAIYWFGGKTEVTGAGTVKLNVLNMNGTTGTTTAGAGQPCPNTELGSVTLGITAIDTSSYLADAFICTFSPFIPVSSDYYIGFDVTNCYPDTLGLVSSTDGDGAAGELCWEKWSDGGWYSLQGAGWGSGTFDVDAAIFPIVDLVGSISEMSFANGVKMSTYPNPSVSNVTLAYELQNNTEKVMVRILDANGSVVEQMVLGAQTAGQYNISLDVTNYAAGNYYFLLNAGSNGAAIKMSITK